MSGKTLLSLALSLSLAALSGCSGTPGNEPDVTSGVPLAELDTEPTVTADAAKPASSRDLVMYQDANARSGAAVDKGDGKHYLNLASSDESPAMKPCVIYDRSIMSRGEYEAAAINCGRKTAKGRVRSYFVPDGMQNPQEAVPADAAKDLLSTYASGGKSDYSVYTLSRWERFCDGGRNMDGLDWKFVKNRSNPFPREMLSTCRLPPVASLKKHGLL